MGSSSSQHKVNRHTRTLQSMIGKLQSMTSSLELSDKTLLEHKQKVQSNYYDRPAHDLPALREGDNVRMRDCVGERRMSVHMKVRH